jgi:predicted dehydrogenase
MNHASQNTNTTRRQFIARTGTAVAGLGLGLSLAPRIYAQSNGANEGVVMGLIGCGGMGMANMDHFLNLGIPIAAICDVDDKHLDHAQKKIVAKGQPAPKRYKDFRKLLEQKDINAVIIGTPDHWHALPFIAACEAGKDIYCEKPISQSFVEAKAMLSAARHFKPVVQIGTWQRSMNHFQKAIEFVQSGKMGDVNVCRAWITGQDKSIGHQTPQPVPAGLDYDMWLGPAPKREYQPNRCHYTWRWFFDYGGGLMTDWGVHMIDIVLLAMKQEPTRVASTGGKFTMNDDRDTPDTMQAIYQFPKFTMNWEYRFNNQRGLDGGRSHGSEFIGTKGTLIVDREGYQYFPNGDSKNAEQPPKLERTESTHWQNFLDCVKTRETPRSGIESMAKTTMLCHLGNISYECGKTVQWDKDKQDITNHSDVKHCISYEREYRSPWKLKMYKS